MEKIILRSATMADAEMVFEWRNAIETRQHSYDANPLNKADHIAWFEKSLAMLNRHLLIAQLDQEALGVLRYDVIDEKAIVSIYLCPRFTGQGYGTQILIAGTEWMTQTLPNVKKLQADVFPENVASQRAFEKANFAVKVYRYEKDITVF